MRYPVPSPPLWMRSLNELTQLPTEYACSFQLNATFVKSSRHSVTRSQSRTRRRNRNKKGPGLQPRPFWSRIPKDAYATTRAYGASRGARCQPLRARYANACRALELHMPTTLNAVAVHCCLNGRGPRAMPNQPRLLLPGAANTPYPSHRPRTASFPGRPRCLAGKSATQRQAFWPHTSSGSVPWSTSI